MEEDDDDGGGSNLVLLPTGPSLHTSAQFSLPFALRNKSCVIEPNRRQRLFLPDHSPRRANSPFV